MAVDADPRTSIWFDHDGTFTSLKEDIGMAKPRWSPAIGGVTTPSITEHGESGIQGDPITNFDSLILAGTADPDIDVSIHSAGLRLGTTTAYRTGAWSFAPPSLADGGNILAAAVGTQPHHVAFGPIMPGIDRTLTPPEIASAAKSTAGVPVWGTAEARPGVSVYREGQLVGPDTGDGNGDRKVPDAALTAPRATYASQAIDAAGDESGPSASVVHATPAPRFTSAATASVPENRTAVPEAQATGGSDAALFSLDAATGGPVSLDDSSESDAAPGAISGSGPAGGSGVSTASATDPDAGATASSGTDGPDLAIVAGGDITRSGGGTLDALAEPTVDLVATATWSNGTTADEYSSASSTEVQSFALNAVELNETFVFETRIAASLDDVEERSTGSIKNGSSDLEMAFDGTRQQTVGLRFTGIEVPQGAIITSAYIQFESDEISTGLASLTIWGEDTGDAAAFADVKFNVSSRTTTDAFVSWSPADWTARNVAGPDQQTPDLTAIVQEIVSRGDWAALNDLVFMITGTGTRIAEAFEGRVGAAPLLHIEYSLPGSASDPVVFDSPPDADAAANLVAELAPAGTAVGITASASDPDAGDTVSYSVDDARFAIDANGVVTRSGSGVLDFETATSVPLRVTALSSDGSIASQAFTVDISDSPEPVAFDDPADVDGTLNRIREDAGAGTAVGITASATDPDAGSIVSYGIDDPRFAIDAGGVITRSAVGTLDVASEPSVDLTVTATSSDGTIATQDFTISVVPAQSETLFRFAVFGDYGDGGAGEAAVAALVDSWNVDFILTTGDNGYGSIAFDDAVGQFFSSYIGNYIGSYGSGSDINRFFPTLGDGDYDGDSAGLNGGIDTYLNYFTLPDNERYYDFQIGSVHFYALNSDSNEPDGNEANSLQAQWFDSAAAASDAMYEIAYFHHTPYRSNGGGDADMRWSFEAGGVDAVFAGHSHSFDLVTRDDNGDGVDLPYITTGMGGFGETSPSSVGANLVTVTDFGMLIDFYLADGTLTGSYFVEAPQGGNPLSLNGHDVMNGSARADYLWGLGGNDTLTGFAGNDMLIGGEGGDLFVFGVGGDSDRVADFVPGAAVSDVLDLRAFNIGSVAEFQQVAVNQGSDVFLDFGGGDTLLLLGVQEEQFHDNDFVAGPLPNDPPRITSPATVTVPENQTAALDVDATDDRAGLVYSISGGTDQALFGIDSATGVLAFLSAPDFEAPGDADANNAYQVQVTVTDTGGLTDVQDITVNVSDTGETLVFETRIAASLDDVEERSTGSVKITSSDLDLVFDGTRQQTIGLRFTGIEVPQGAIITRAYIQFESDEVSTGLASLTIRGEDTSDAAAFSDARFNVSSRTTTDAFVSWSPADWTARNVAGPDQQTPDLTAIVQEIVSRGDWAALNDLVFTITGTGTRVAEAFEGRAGAAPLLHIEYSLSGPASDPVAFDSPPDADAAANRIAELAPAGTSVGITASASDPDAGDTVSYSVDDARFAVDANGVVTRSGSGVLDYETASTVSLTVTALSSDGSIASQVFTVDISDSPEPVAFDDPADSDSGVNRVAQDAAAGTAVGLTASATDPDAGATVSYGIDDPRFAIDAGGVVTRSNVGALDALAEPSVDLTVTATSSDGSFATETFSVSVVSETLPQTLTLAKVTDTGQWSPSSPDPSGIAYISHLNTLLVSDGEVNEMPIFTGDNLFMATLGGSLLDTLTSIGFSDEPTGAAYNPSNRHLFFSDDTGTRSVYELNPGGDGAYGTPDDVVTSFRTADFGSSDPEGLAYDPGQNVLYLVDGVTATVHTIDPGANGVFDGLASRGGDDIVTSFDAGVLGAHDPEGLEYDPRYDILYITSGDNIAMLSTDGDLLGLLDISAADVRSPAGLALGPSSADPTLMSLYLADRGVDNNSDPNENDGKIYEFVIDDPLTV